MIIHALIQGSNIDIYPSGYDLTLAGSSLDFSKPNNLVDDVQSCHQFVEQLLHYNPAVAHQLSSFVTFSQQVLDIKQQFEAGSLVAIYPKDKSKGAHKTKSWLEADSITMDALNAKSQHRVQPQNLTPYNRKRNAVHSELAAVKAESHDYQLTVEIAGHNLPRNQFLMLDQVAAEPSIAQFSANDNRHPHRSLVNFQHISRSSRKLSLAINMSSGPSPMRLPLTSKNLVPSRNSYSNAEMDTILIPIKPLRHRSPTQNTKQTVELSDGWLYVFWQGQLWRELDISPNSALRDCRVEWYRNQIRFGLHNHEDLRTAEGHGLDNIWLPYKINNEYQLGRNGFRVAFSEAQWSWTLIEALESDPDSLIAKTTSLDAIKQYSQKQSFDTASDSINAIEIAMSTSQSKQSNDANIPSKIAVIYLTPEPNKICLKLSDHNLTALTGKRYQLVAGENTLEGTLPANGIINEPIPHTVTEGELRVWCHSESDSPSHRIPIKLGQLAPIETPAGIQARLNNLNHHTGVIDGITGRKTLAAIKQFQQQNNLTIDGDAGPITRGKLREIHGS